MLAPSGCKLSAHIRILGAGLPEAPDTDPQSYVGSLRWQEKQAAPLSVPLCEQCHGQMRLSYTFPAYSLQAACYLQTFVLLHEGCERSLTVTTSIPRLRLNFELARQASSPSLCASVPAVPWADEDEQQLSRLALSGCELSAHVRILGPELLETPGKDL